MSTKQDQDLSLSDVGSDNPAPPPPGAAPPDNPPTGKTPDKPDNDNAVVAWSVLGIVVCAVVTGGAVAIWAYGWWAVAAVVVALVIVCIAAYWWWRHRTRQTRRSQRTSSTSRTGRPGSSPGRHRRAGMGRGTGSGTSQSGRKRGMLSRLNPFGKSRGSSRGASGGSSRGGRGVSRSRVPGFGGRGRGTLLGTRSGGTGGGRSRRARRRGNHTMGMPSLGLGDAARATGRGILRGDRALGDALTDAVDAIRPNTDKDPDGPKATTKSTGLWPTASEGARSMSTFRSLFEQITEDLPQAALRDEITSHDMGLEPLMQGFQNGMPHIADYIKNARERIEVENNAGTEGSVLEALEVLEKAQRSNAILAASALKVLRGSPTWQAMQARMENPNGHKSDVSTARQMGY